MPSTHRLQASFSQSIGKELPSIPGLRSMCYFGSGYDGNNGNRVAGGPAPIVLGSPVYSSNYVTVGYNGSSSPCIDLAMQRTSAVLAAGWTWAAVWRITAAGSVGGTIIGDLGGGGGTIPLIGTTCSMVGQSAASFQTFIQSNGQSNKATFVLPGKNSSNWHFEALTYTGGATGTLSLNEFTDVPAGSTPATWVVATALTAGNNSPTLGNLVPNGSSAWAYPIDVAWAMVAQGAMNQTDLAALAAAVRPWLARRNITA